MTNISSYVDYLPSVLWSQENDPSQFLGRVLRIFEKILTGINVDAQAVRVSVKIDNTLDNEIKLTSIADAAKFRVGDRIKIEGTEGTTKQELVIDCIKGAEIFLKEDLDLIDSFNSGNMRINDLTPGQKTFRVDNTTGLEPGIVIKIIQGKKSEERTIQKLTDNFITLSSGLANTYSMALTDVPVRIQDKITIDAQAIKAKATIKNVNDFIQLNDNANAAKFRPGDVIKIEGKIEGIEGTTEQVRTIDHIQGALIFLDTNLTGSLSGGNILINDLKPDQTTFRVDNTTGIEPGSVIKITQGAKSEEKIIQKLTDNFITLSSDFVNTYSMALTDVPVRIQGTSIIHRANAHDDFEKTIDELRQIFNPWHTDFLPWLASWVALTLQEEWSEYQKRKLVSEIVSIYQNHGLKKGLHAYLDIYAATEARPRIAIDDGDAIFRATFLDNGTAVLHTVAHSSEVLGQTILLHPSAIAADSDNNYIVVDYDFYSPRPQKPTLWKVSSTGEIEYKSTPNIPPTPRYIHSDDPLVNPTAVVVDKQNRYSVVDAGSKEAHNSAIYRFDPPAYTSHTKIIDRSNPSFEVGYPVDMVLDGSENFVILDRGTYPSGETPTSPDSGQKIVVVSEKPVSEEPPAVAEHDLKEVIEPTALTMNPMGYFIVADSKDQFTSDPADLIMVDPTAIEWSETSLLNTVPVGENPLIFPIGLAFENPQSLLVCDSGIRRGFEEVGDLNNRTMAEPAAIYRVDLSQTPPTITRVTYERKLVNPTKMMIDRKGNLIITDKGESNQNPSREWRSKANEFGISVFFSQQRFTSSDDRNRIRRGIENVINEQKPGHTFWWMKS